MLASIKKHVESRISDQSIQNRYLTSHRLQLVILHIIRGCKQHHTSKNMLHRHTHHRSRCIQRWIFVNNLAKKLN